MRLVFISSPEFDGPIFGLLRLSRSGAKRIVRRVTPTGEDPGVRRSGDLGQARERCEQLDSVSGALGRGE